MRFLQPARSGIVEMHKQWLGADASSWLDIALEPILREPRSSVIERERSTFDRLAAPDPSAIVLFGAGALGKAAVKGLRRVGIEPLAFADNRAELWDRKLDDIDVYSPARAAERFGSSAAFVVTIYNGSSARQQLRQLGCEFVVPFAPLFWKHAEVFLPEQGLDLPHRIQDQVDDIRAGYAVLADERSRREFCEQIRWRFNLEYDCLSPPIHGDTYYPHEVVKPSHSEVLVDCGAFDGDSIRAYMATRGPAFRRIYALEPDPVNRAALLRFIGELSASVSSRITVLPFAAGEKTGMISFSASNAGRSSMVSGPPTAEVECRALDDLLKDEMPTYIKMDIEAAEPAAIRGARKLIEAHSPVVAACVYHRCEHLWQIPAQLKQSSKEYQLFLRRYAEESWEMICYAVPKWRLPARQIRSMVAPG